MTPEIDIVGLKRELRARIYNEFQKDNPSYQFAPPEESFNKPTDDSLRIFSRNYSHFYISFKDKNDIVIGLHGQRKKRRLLGLPETVKEPTKVTLDGLPNELTAEVPGKTKGQRGDGERPGRM